MKSNNLELMKIAATLLITQPDYSYFNIEKRKEFKELVLNLKDIQTELEKNR